MTAKELYVALGDLMVGEQKGFKVKVSKQLTPGDELNHIAIRENYGTSEGEIVLMAKPKKIGSDSETVESLSIKLSDLVKQGKGKWLVDNGTHLIGEILLDEEYEGVTIK